MEGFAEVVRDLISGTAVEKNELELARLRALPPDEQLEVGIVLREAMLRRKFSPDRRQNRLVSVKNVEDARNFLERENQTSPCAGSFD
jgi:hypothetical protein